MPIGFLDGGRIVTALSPWLWLVGFVVLVFLTITRFNFILVLILIFSLPRLFSLFRPKTDDERRYFEVTSEQRLLMGAAYFGLIAALVFGMRLTLIPPESLQGKRDQVVIGVPNDARTDELSRRRLTAQIDAAIDIRRVRLTAGHPITLPPSNGQGGCSGGGADQTVLPRTDLSCFQIPRARLAFDQHHGFAADARGGNLPGNL